MSKISEAAKISLQDAIMEAMRYLSDEDILEEVQATLEQAPPELTGRTDE